MLLLFNNYKEKNETNAFFHWKTKAAEAVETSIDAIKCLHDMVGNCIYTKNIEGFTEIKKHNVLYRADVNHRNKGFWFDNVMVLWESTISQDSDYDSMKDNVSSSGTLI